MARKTVYEMTEQQKHLRERKRSKINIRHNSPSGRKSRKKGKEVWLKTRRRFRRRLLGR